VRDRRWDFLYDRQRQPVAEFLLERFAERLASDLSGWPPPLEWVSAELEHRYAAGLEARPSDDGIRLAFELARLDLTRALETSERLLEAEGPRSWRSPAETAAGHLLVQFLVESCLALKEAATGARLTREGLAEALRLAEKRLLAA
jgi:hypothetical protein